MVGRQERELLKPQQNDGSERQKNQGLSTPLKLSNAINRTQTVGEQRGDPQFLEDWGTHMWGPKPPTGQRPEEYLAKESELG